jgi:hypothetical protein
VRTWPPMSEEERSVLSLPPKLQQRMAMLVLKGWRFERREFIDGAHNWRAWAPDTVPRHASRVSNTLLLLLEDLVGYDVVWQGVPYEAH